MRLHMRPRAIQDQTSWIVQSKRGAGKCIAPNHVDLDGMTNIGSEYMLDHD
jgi:hypothetical protein